MTVNNDPDGLACYSDHAEDIRAHGECSMCTSTEVDVVGHVLPAVPRVTKLDPVEAARLVLDTQTGTIVDGIFLDTFSASYVVAVHDKLSPENQARLRSWPLVKAVDACFRLVNRSQQ